MSKGKLLAAGFYQCRMWDGRKMSMQQYSQADNWDACDSTFRFVGIYQKSETVEGRIQDAIKTRKEFAGFEVRKRFAYVVRVYLKEKKDG